MIYEQINDPDLLLYKLDFNHTIIEKALEITAEYVAQHKLILTGGTAIDMALRSKGSSIYDENALPDYDIISENNLNHAAALAEILCKDGIKDISVINAIHITTVRVRCKNITLLDATYLPENIIKKIPYLDIGKFRIIHPNYQKIDQRLSLSNLMNDTGISLNIFNRLDKDHKRNKILRDYFKINNDLAMEHTHISESNQLIPNKFKIFTKRIKLSLDLLKHDPNYLNKIDANCFIYTGNICISGFLAYAIYYYEYIKHNKPINDTIDPNVIITKNSIEFDLPKEATISLLNCSDNPIETLELITGIKKNKFKKYNPIANIKPITVKCSTTSYPIEISDTYGSRISAFILENMCVASTDYILMQFLRDRIYADTEQLRAINSLYYDSLLTMSIDRQNYDIQSNNQIWFPSINCYGYDILPEYKAFTFQKILNPEESKDFKPKNSYLRVPDCKTKTEFDPLASHYFLIDGLENPEIIHTNLKYISKQIKST